MSRAILLLPVKRRALCKSTAKRHAIFGRSAANHSWSYLITAPHRRRPVHRAAIEEGKPVSQEKFAASFAAAVQPVTVNGTVGLGTFIRVAVDWLKGLARDQVDTEEERDALVAVVMSAADRLVGGKFPPLVWPLVRGPLQAFLDSAIDSLPALLA